MNIISTTDIESAAHRDGGIRYFFGITAGLARRGHCVDVIFPEMPGSESLVNEFPELRFNFFPTSNSGGIKEFTKAVNCRRGINRRLCSGDCDIVLFSQPKSSIGPVLIKGASNVPAVYHFLSPWAAEYEIKTGGNRGPTWQARRFLEKKILQRCRAIVVMSGYMREQLLAFHPELEKGNIYVIPGGVDQDRFCIADRAAARERTTIPADRPVIFTARNFTARTGVDILVDAMPEVVKRHPDVLLVLGGDGELRPRIESRAQSLGLGGSVRFEGFIPDERLPLYFQAADIFALPTRSLEGFGLVTVEALACGTPVVATPVGANTELLRPLDPDLLASDVSPESFAEKLIYWLDRIHVVRTNADRFRNYVLVNYTWDKVAEMIEACYIGILNEASTNR